MVLVSLIKYHQTPGYQLTPTSYTFQKPELLIWSAYSYILEHSPKLSLKGRISAPMYHPEMGPYYLPEKMMSCQNLYFSWLKRTFLNPFTTYLRSYFPWTGAYVIWLCFPCLCFSNSETVQLKIEKKQRNKNKYLSCRTKSKQVNNYSKSKCSSKHTT